MEENSSSTTLIDISRYCSSFPDGDLWSSSSRSPTQRFVTQTPTCSSGSDSPILPSLPLPPSHWSIAQSFANLELDSSLWSSTSISTEKHQVCNCCRCLKSNELWPENIQINQSRSRQFKDSSSTSKVPTPIQRPSSSSPRSMNTTAKLSIFDSYRDKNQMKKIHFDNDENHSENEENNDDGTLRLHVSNIPFTWSKEKLADVFGKYGTTFDVEVVYNERGSKGFGFVTFLSKKDALEAKRKMDREIVDGRRLVVNFAKPKQKSNSSSKDHSTSTFNNFKTSSPSTWKPQNSSERSSRNNTTSYQSLGFSTPPTARRQHLAGFSSLSSTPTRSSTSNQSQRHYL